MAKSRPTGITVLSILYILGGILLLIGGIASAALPGLLSSSTALSGAGAATLKNIASLLGITFIIVGIISFVIAYGLWKGAKWGWWLTVVLTGLGVIFAIVSLVSGAIFSIISLIIEGVILYYMFQKDTKAYFNVKI